MTTATENTTTNGSHNGHADPQENLLDTVIQNDELEAALEERDKRNASRKALAKKFKEADEKARGIIAALDLDADMTIRVGRFRITRTEVAGRSVAFETEATERLTISTVGD